MTRSIRIITTHDFFGSLAPLPTTYGSLPGGEGLRKTVRQLKQQGPTLWIDSGDLIFGGPLSTFNPGDSGIQVARELGPDVSVVGNHDLDFGSIHLLQAAKKLGFPILCANAELGLPATTLLETSQGAVGVIGLTHPRLQTMWQWSAKPQRDLPVQLPDTDIPRLAANLRQQGAEAVIAVVHDGPDWSFPIGGTYRSGIDRFAADCRHWADKVDLIVCGHTLGRFIGHIHGTPVLQPWPFGVELGMYDLQLASLRKEGIPQAVKVEQDGPWSGYGHGFIQEASLDYLGDLHGSAIARSTGPSPLASLVAEATYAVAGEVDVALCYVSCGQPTIDGIFAYLPSGPVSRLQLLQITPWTDHTIVVSEMDPHDLQSVITKLGESRYSQDTAWGVAGTVSMKKSFVRVATLSGAAPALIDSITGRCHIWTAVSRNLFEGITAVLQ
jgi:hypothetical protein